MSLKETLKESLKEATTEVLASSLSSIPTVKERQRALNEKDGANLVVSVGISGSIKGAIILILTDDSACSIVSKMLGTEVKEMSQDVCDGVGEVANMLSGSFKTKLAPSGQSFNISLPTVVKGGGCGLDVSQPHETDIIELHAETKDFFFEVVLFFSTAPDFTEQKIEEKAEEWINFIQKLR